MRGLPPVVTVLALGLHAPSCPWAESVPEPAVAAAGQAVAREETKVETPPAGTVAVVPEPVPSGPVVPASDRAGTCPDRDAADLGILVSPRRPWAGAPLRVIAATFEGEDAPAVRFERDGVEITAALEVRPGVPAATLAALEAPLAGSLRVIVGRDGHGLACQTITIASRHADASPRPASADHVWPVSRAWTGAEEALFSAWVRELFHAERGRDLAWSALHEVTSDATRNLLHDHYGWNEDAADTNLGLHLRPDCADTPYFLRAYYAWKRELPFGFRRCSRGSAGKAPRCGDFQGTLDPPEDVAAAPNKPGELGLVQRYFRKTLAWGVHTGNGRTAFGDTSTDVYPLALTRRALRPGAIYADPYGHVFVLVELVPPAGTLPGVLYAIDGQPDGSITRKRYWEGNFLWNPDPALGGSGFKAFRPVDVVRDTGRDANAPRSRQASDAEIAARPGYGDVSDEQRTLVPTAFYDRMDALVTPGPRDPLAAQAEAVRALSEAAKVRVTSVANGEAFLASTSSVVEMPSGHAIFETTGAWENYATPARDLRLLIAIDVVRGFEAKVERNRSVFLREGQSIEDVHRELRGARTRLLADPELAFRYTRSDGSSWTLTLAEVLDRAASFEVGYNPNDCPEHRWGAPEGSEERSTCRRRAPEAQRRKMNVYRVWFEARKRPARGDPGPSVD